MSEKTEAKSPLDRRGVILAALALSAAGALFYNMLPLYLGVAQDYLDMDNRSIGLLGSAFYLGYNLATLSAFFWIRRWNWRTITLIATLTALTCLTIGGLTASFAIQLLVVIVGGAAFSVLYGLGVTVIADTSHPAKWYGVKVACEAGHGALVLLLQPILIAKWGYGGMIFGMVFAVLIICPLIVALPTRGTRGVTSDPAAGDGAAKSRRPDFTIWLALIALLLFFCGETATWAFLERIGIGQGYDSTSVSTLLAVALLCAMSGSFVAAVAGEKFGIVRSFECACLCFLLALFFISFGESFVSYAMGVCAVLFSVGLGLPLGFTVIAELDSDGRYAVLAVPAVGIGAMIAPGAAGALAANGNFAPALAFGGSAVLCSALLFLFTVKKSSTLALGYQ